MKSAKQSPKSLDDIFASIHLPLPEEIARTEIQKKIPDPYAKRRKALFSSDQGEEFSRRIQEERVLLNRPQSEEQVRGRMEAEQVASLYSLNHAKYYNHRPKDWRYLLRTHKGVLGCCSKAAVTASLLQCSLDDFIDAQFWFYHQNFGKPPAYKDLAGPGAARRVEAFLEFKKESKGKVSKAVSVATGGTIDPSKYTADEVFAYEASILKKMIAKWGSEEVIWEMWGDVEEEDIFSNSFKMSRPIWNKMYQK